MPKRKSRPSGCGRLVLTWLAAALAVVFTAWLLPGVHVKGLFPAAFLAAAIIGFGNAIVRPFLIVVTLPVTLLTMGLFLLVINGLMLELADLFLAGFQVDGLLWAALGSIVLSVATTALERMFGVEEED